MHRILGPARTKEAVPCRCQVLGSDPSPMLPMKLFSILALPVVLALPAALPSPDLSLKRSFTTEATQELTEFTVVLGGEEVPAQYLPDMELVVKFSRHLVVLDHLDGKSMARTFETARLDGSQDFFLPPSMDTQDEGHATSPLEGLTVRFDEDQRPSWVGDAGKDALLEGLEPSLDLSALLTGSHGVGDTWSVDAADLHALFLPGGDLAWEWTSTPGFQAPDPESAFHTGVFRVTFDSLSEGVAEIRLTATLELEAESETDLSTVPVADGSATEVRTTTYEVAGSGHVDTVHQRILDLDLDADLYTVIETTKDDGQPGPAYSSTMTLEGDWSLRVQNAAR